MFSGTVSGSKILVICTTTDGCTTLAEVAITSTTKTGCGCHRLTATRPGPGEPQVMHVLTGCFDHTDERLTETDFDGLVAADTGGLLDDGPAEHLTALGLLTGGKLTDTGTAVLVEWCRALTDNLTFATAA